MQYRKLGRTSPQRKAMIRSLVTQLLWHEKIKTTEARAKETRKEVEKLIKLAVKEKDNYEIISSDNIDEYFKKLEEEKKSEKN